MNAQKTWGKCELTRRAMGPGPKGQPWALSTTKFSWYLKHWQSEGSCLGNFPFLGAFSCRHSYNQCLLSTYYIPGSILGVRDLKRNKTKSLEVILFQGQWAINKWINRKYGSHSDKSSELVQRNSLEKKGVRLTILYKGATKTSLMSERSCRDWK